METGQEKLKMKHHELRRRGKYRINLPSRHAALTFCAPKKFQPEIENELNLVANATFLFRSATVSV